LRLRIEVFPVKSIFKTSKYFQKIRKSPTEEVLSPELDAYMVSQMTGRAIYSGRPFLASRLGFTEARCLSQPYANANPSEFIRDLMWRYSGVFPTTKEHFLDFREKYLSALCEVDLLGVIKNPA